MHQPQHHRRPGGRGDVPRDPGWGGHSHSCPSCPCFLCSHPGAPWSERKPACLHTLCPSDTAAASGHSDFLFHSPPTHHSPYSESQEQGSVVTWPKIPEIRACFLGRQREHPGPHTQGTSVLSCSILAPAMPISEARKLRLRALPSVTQEWESQASNPGLSVFQRQISQSRPVLPDRNLTQATQAI